LSSPRLVHYARCPVRESSSPRVGVSASCPVTTCTGVPGRVEVDDLDAAEHFLAELRDGSRQRVEHVQVSLDPRARLVERVALTGVARHRLQRRPVTVVRQTARRAAVRRALVVTVDRRRLDQRAVHFKTRRTNRRRRDGFWFTAN